VLHLKLGTSAPCSGLLWPEAHSKIALSCLKVEIPRLEARVLKLKAEHLADLKALRTKLDATTNALAESEKRFEEMVVPVDPWYESPILWGVVGVVVGVALTAGAVKLAGELD
jgi:16S rRNA G966 N2-methylase RsmD